MKRGWLATNPALDTAPKQSRVKQSRPELRFLTERELERALRLANGHCDILAVAVGTGLRFGELGALWVGDVDLNRGTAGEQGVETQRRGRCHRHPGMAGPAVAAETPDAGPPSRQSEDAAVAADHHGGTDGGRSAAEADRESLGR